MAIKDIYFSPALPHKFPNWNTGLFNSKILNRTHMYGPVKQQIKNSLDLMRKILEIPKDSEIFFVPASCSGAILCAFLNFFSDNVLIYKSGYFSEQFSVDIKQICSNWQEVEEGSEFEYKSYNADRFLVYTETTQAKKYKNFDFLPEVKDVENITIVDAAAAIFLEKMDWNKFDIVAGCCQKVLGGDGSLGFFNNQSKSLK